MKKALLFAALVFSAAAASSAQDAASFGGTWSLDLSSSKLEQRGPQIESMKMTVTQTARDITIATETKRQAPPEGGRPGGMGRGGFGDGTFTYTLDGKETKAEAAGPMGPMPVTLKAAIEAGKLKLSNARTFSGPMGEITATTRETWSLSADGKTLTVEREMESPRGTSSSTLVFAKQ